LSLHENPHARSRLDSAADGRLLHALDSAAAATQQLADAKRNKKSKSKNKSQNQGKNQSQNQNQGENASANDVSTISGDANSGDSDAGGANETVTASDFDPTAEPSEADKALEAQQKRQQMAAAQIGSAMRAVESGLCGRRWRQSWHLPRIAEYLNHMHDTKQTLCRVETIHRYFHKRSQCFFAPYSVTAHLATCQRSVSILSCPIV
jgi:hypothetical protein